MLPAVITDQLEETFIFSLKDKTARLFIETEMLI